MHKTYSEALDKNGLYFNCKFVYNTYLFKYSNNHWKHLGGALLQKNLFFSTRFYFPTKRDISISLPTFYLFLTIFHEIYKS